MPQTENLIMPNGKASRSESKVENAVAKKYDHSQCSMENKGVIPAEE